MLTPYVLNQNLPWGFLARLVESTCSGSDADSVTRVFQPLLHGLLHAVRQCGLDTDDFKRPLEALAELCEMKIGSRRPICKLVGLFSRSLEQCLLQVFTLRLRCPEFMFKIYFSDYRAIELAAWRHERRRWSGSRVSLIPRSFPSAVCVR